MGSTFSSSFGSASDVSTIVPLDAQEATSGAVQTRECFAIRKPDSEADEEEQLCRYCFEGGEAGELIAPCRCAGGQRWVHLSCLRRWQRGILVSQPTHPDYYDDDVRHRVCGVCKSPFTCRPPTRLELMQSFTGEELAALVEEGCFIGTHRDFSQEMRRQVSAFPTPLQEAVMDRHWIDGMFLIVKVMEDKSQVIRLRIERTQEVAAFASMLSEDWCWQYRGRLYRLVFEGPLEALVEATAEAKRAALQELQAPCVMKLALAEDGDCGEDGIMAVNLTRPLDISGPHQSQKEAHFQNAVRKALPEGASLLPEVVHFVGGPCHETRAQYSIVVSGENYHIYTRLTQAIAAAQELCGQPVEVDVMEDRSRTSSSEAARDDGEEMLTSSPSDPFLTPPAKRRREEAGDSDDASTAASTVAALESLGGRDSVIGDASANTANRVRLFVFWGTAGWSRCQLMGEIASGSWGLCKASVHEIVNVRSAELYEYVYPRLIFAPKTEMSETYGQGPIEEDQTRLLRIHHRLLRRQRLQAERRHRESSLEALPEGQPIAGRDGVNPDPIVRPGGDTVPTDDEEYDNEDDSGEEDAFDEDDDDEEEEDEEEREYLQRLDDVVVV